MVHQVEGGLLGVTEDGITGWAVDRDRPSQVVRVIILAGGEPFAGTVADRYDLSSVKSMVGPGVPGFAVRLSSMLWQVPPFEMTVRTMNGARLGTPILIRSKDELLPALVGETAYEGFVDLLGNGRMMGWACNSAQSERCVSIVILDGEARIGRATANLQRDDLHAAGKRDGMCGFEWELPTSLLDGYPHSLRVMTEDGRYELQNSPISFGPTNLHRLFKELATLRSHVETLTQTVRSLSDQAERTQLNRHQSAAEREN